MIEVKLKLAHKGVKIPTYATDGSGCFDIYADLEESYYTLGGFGSTG